MPSLVSSGWPIPLCPQKRTLISALSPSALSQKATVVRFFSSGVRLFQRLLIELLRAESDIQPQHGASGEGVVLADVRGAAVLGILQVGNRGDVFVVGPQRQAGARAELLARLERDGADKGEIFARLGILELKSKKSNAKRPS